MNQVDLIGRLAQDPVLKTLQTGSTVTSFALAVDRRTRQEGAQNVDFIDCVAWGKTAENLCRYMSKGRQIGVSGHLQKRNWQTQDGQTRYVTEVVADRIEFLSDGNRVNAQPQAQTSHNSKNTGPLTLDDDFSLISDDDPILF